ncbi:MAG: hypothetical protein Q9224_007755 [Gallowayella concinna]
MSLVKNFIEENTLTEYTHPSKRFTIEFSPPSALPPLKVGARNIPRTCWRGWLTLGGRRHTKPHLTNPPQQRLQRQPNLSAQFTIQQLHSKGIKGINVFFEPFKWEVGVAFHDIHDDGPPGFDIARLGFVKADEAAHDVRT